MWSGLILSAKGHSCEIRVRLDSEAMHHANEWAQNGRSASGVSLKRSFLSSVGVNGTQTDTTCDPSSV